VGKIVELPKLQRPREKALRYGIDQLSDYELIAILIGSGFVDSSALDIAYKMLSDSGGLRKLIQKPLLNLMNYKGIKEAKSIKLLACFEIAKRVEIEKGNDKDVAVDAPYVYWHCKSLISLTNQEYLFILILNKKHQLIHEMNLYKGNESSISISITQILQQVLIHGGRYFYVVHNHPSGSLEPSENDIFITSELIKQSKRLKIQLIDHLIITDEGYYSFLEK